MHIVKSKKPIWKGCILFDFNYMILWKRQNGGNSKSMVSRFVIEGGMNNRHSVEDFIGW